MDDFQKILHDADAESQRALQERRTAEERIRATEREYEDAWKAVLACCLAGDQDASRVPDLTPFLDLAAVLKARGWDGWLPEMAKSISADLHSHLISRRDELFIVNLLIEASKKRASARRLAKTYKARTQGQTLPSWRTSAADDVRQFFMVRISQAPMEKERLEAEQSQQERLSQIESVRKSTTRGAAWRNLQFLTRYQVLLGTDSAERINASIRDWWNAQHPDQPCHKNGDRRKGAEVVRAGVRSATALVRKLQSRGVTLSIEEMIAALTPNT